MGDGVSGLDGAEKKGRSDAAFFIFGWD